MKIMNKMNQRLNKDSRILELVEENKDDDILSDLKIYLN